jgi:ABC-type Fe3+/spermidine/putrescine transport system ATPase subunit
MRKLPIDHDKRAADLLELVQLGGLGGRYPRQLSGGQRQRVALARALASNPKLLLLDEPFGALDAVVRKQLRAGLKEIVRSVGVTTLIVTHDQEEAFDLADKARARRRAWEGFDGLGVRRAVVHALRSALPPSHISGVAPPIHPPFHPQT